MPQEPNAEPIDQDTLDIKALAAAILAREVRPRVGSVRRLAEAVLAQGSKPAKPAKKKKKSSGKKRKQAKIPGQKKDQPKAK